MLNAQRLIMAIGRRATNVPYKKCIMTATRCMHNSILLSVWSDIRGLTMMNCTFYTARNDSCILYKYLLTTLIIIKKTLLSVTDEWCAM